MSYVPSIGVAISVFNKVPEVKTNVNIIRAHWQSCNDTFISVCCNDPDSIEMIREIQGANAVILGDQIPSVPKPKLRLRQFDCIKKSMSANEADYVIHWHADAFALASDSVEKIVSEMWLRGVRVAFRGRGLDYYNKKTLYGDVDDHFFILDKKSINDGFFDIRASDYLGECNVESLLSMRVKQFFNEKEIFHYDDMSSNLVGSNVSPDPFYHDNIQHRAMNPFNIDVDRKFIHCQTREVIREKLLEYNVKEDILEL